VDVVQQRGRHRAHIMLELQLECRAELVMFALPNGVTGPGAD
jgi:hypothetical protein